MVRACLTVTNAKLPSWISSFCDDYDRSFIYVVASTTHYKVVDEHPVLSQAKLLAARRHRAQRQAPDPLVNMTVRVSGWLLKH